MRDQRVEASRDAAVAAIAAHQHGVVSVHQLRAAGFDKRATARRVAAGRLHRVYRGVYAVGHPGLGNEGKWMAAVLAGGEGAVLSHRSAAELWEMLKPTDGPVHVTVPVAGGRQRRSGLRLHRCPALPHTATTLRNGIAVTTPAHTLTDLRPVCSPAEHRRATRQAEFAGLPIGDHSRESDRTRSDLERRFVRLCHRHHLPPPEVNVRIGPYTVDFLWRELRVVVETDGYGAHRGRQAFEDDRERDNELAMQGYDVLRFSYARVLNEPARVARIVRARLNRAGN
jgi:very-short-patch-repair endonuclease